MISVAIPHGYGIVAYERAKILTMPPNLHATVKVIGTHAGAKIDVLLS